MAQYKKLFTHPVLNSINGDYKNGSFEIGLEPINKLRQTILNITIDLKNNDLRKLIDNGKAAFLVKTECPYTCLRLPTVTKETEIEQKIESGRLKDDVFVNACIVATDNIKDYSSSDFNDDYKGVSFDLSKGDILAESDTMQFKAFKDSTKIEDMPPIITVQLDKKFDRDKKNAEVWLNNDIIAIHMCSEEFKNYNSLYKQPRMRDVIFSMMIVPALMEVFETLKTEGTENYCEYNWFKAISKELDGEITMNEEKFDMEEYSSFTLAQRSLENPLGKALRSLLKYNSTEEET